MRGRRFSDSPKIREIPAGCPGLVRGRFTLAAKIEQPTLEDATALRGGGSRSLLSASGASSKREPPRGEPVASKAASSLLLVVTNVRLPPDKPGASVSGFHVL